MKIGKYVLTALMVLGLAGMVYAAPVGLTSEADATKSVQTWSNGNVALNVGVAGDFVSKRKIDTNNGEIELDVLAGRIGVNIIDKFNLYVDLGTVRNMTYNSDVGTSVLKYDYDDAFAWGIGANALIYRWNNGLEIGAGANYRQADVEIDKVTIDGVSYARSKMDSVRDNDYKEWQGALELAWRTNYFIPYAGVKYSDVEVNGDVTYATVQYKSVDKNSSEKVGAFVGLTITPKLSNVTKSEQIAINVEGRFIDEEAISAGISYKF